MAAAMAAAMSAVAFPYGGFDGRCGQDRKAGTAHRRQRHTTSVTLGTPQILFPPKRK